MSSPAPHRSALGPCPLCAFDCSSVIARSAQRPPRIGDFISCGRCLAPLKVSATGLSILNEAERVEFVELVRRMTAHQSRPLRTRPAVRCIARADAHLQPRCELEHSHRGPHGAWSVASAERLEW